MSTETENIHQNITKIIRYMVVERRAIFNGSLVDMRIGNWVDVTVKEKRAVFGLFILLAFHSQFSEINAGQMRVCYSLEISTFIMRKLRQNMFLNSFYVKKVQKY